jgi:PEP-CTERM motif
MKTTFSRLAPLVAAVALSLSAGAQAAEMVTDGSFEATGASFAVNGSYCYIGYAPIDCALPSGSPWSGTAALILVSSGPWQNPSSLGGFAASQGAVVAGLQNFSTLSQTLALTAGSYTVSWLDAGRIYGNTQNYDIIFDSNTLGTFMTTAGQAWSSHTLTFTATGAGTLTFKGLGLAADGTSFIDNVSVTPVPEASTLAMMLAGLVGLSAVARRRKA